MQPERATSQVLPHEDDAHYRAILHELIDRGMDLARHIHTQAKSEPNPAATPAAHEAIDPTIQFDRIARAIRRTIALARHIAANPARPAQTTNTEQTRARLMRARLIRGVEDAIYRRRNEYDTGPLYAEFAERMDRPDLAEDLAHDLATRPVDDIIHEIARDLGVFQPGRTAVFKRRTPADLAALKSRAAEPRHAPEITRAITRLHRSRPNPTPSGPEPPT